MNYVCYVVRFFLSSFQSIPGRGGRQKGMRTLSESEERQMDEAIELANSYALKSTTDHMVSTPSPKTAESLNDRSHGDSDGNSAISSPKILSVFNLRKKGSPKQDKKTYTDEMANITDASEDVSAEAQEAYNMLIVKGSFKENRESSSNRFTAAREGLIARNARERQPSGGEEKPALVPRANRNIRAPQGIPGRGTSQSSTDSGDSNPLRRLRDSTAIIPPKTKPKPSQATLSDRFISNGRHEHVKKPNLSANLPFFDKLKEQELSQDSGEGSEEGMVVNPVPLPPRTRSINSSNSSSFSSKPRQRKYPLDLSQYKGGSGLITSNQLNSSSGTPDCELTTDTSHTTSTTDLNSSRGSSDSVFSSSSPSSSLERGGSTENTSIDSQFSVKSVKLTAKDLGYQDTSDLFWSKPVKLEDLGPSQTGDGGGVIPGRYKTSDTVSYEDLLEFALDGVSERYFMLHYVLFFNRFMFVFFFPVY